MSIDVYPPRGYLTSYEEGSFTVTATGFTTTVTGTAEYIRIGKQITLIFPGLSGTSNATTMTLTGIPAAITPLHIGYYIVLVRDGGVNKEGLLELENASTIFNVYPTVIAGATWIASGTKLVASTAIVYRIA